MECAVQMAGAGGEVGDGARLTLHRALVEAVLLVLRDCGRIGDVQISSSAAANHYRNAKG